MNTIFIASDHNGNAARACIVRILSQIGENVIDLGPSESEGKVDYPVVAANLCRRVLVSSTFRSTYGILICGTGAGMCIAANRFKGIRAALVTDKETARLSREHNDANVLVLGQWRTPIGSMEEIVRSWLDSEFGEQRHVRRLEKLELIGGVDVKIVNSKGEIIV
jgi:ribose 5-phosphate isomerase B